MAHILNRMLPASLRGLLRELALKSIPSMRHLDMRMRLRQMASSGLRPSMILDVGAATGEWVRMAAAIWPDARIFGVEPNESVAPRLKELKRELSHFDYWRGFLGPESTTVTYADRSYQTSLLDRDSNQSGNASAAMTTLDQLLVDRGLPSPDLIKLDVQGYELEVLKGATRAMEKTQAVLLEVSFFRFFAGMPLAGDVVTFMSERGFAWHDVMGIYRREPDDALAQMDFMFLRADHPLRNSNAW